MSYKCSVNKKLWQVLLKSESSENKSYQSSSNNYLDWKNKKKKRKKWKIEQAFLTNWDFQICHSKSQILRNIFWEGSIWVFLLEVEENGRVAEWIRAMFLKLWPWTLKDQWNIFRRFLNTCDLGRLIENHFCVPPQGQVWGRGPSFTESFCHPPFDSPGVWGRKMVMQLWALLLPWCLCDTWQL